MKEWKSKLPETFDVVKEGGWYKVQSDALKELGKANFSKLRPHLPKDQFIVGEEDTLEALSVDPKGYLMQCVQQLQGSTNAANLDHLDAAVALLHAQGKGYDSDTVEGDWVMVMQRQGNKSPKVQKLVGKAERKNKSYSTFDVDHLEFSGDVKLLKGLLTVSSTVKYSPLAENADTVNGKVVLRRIKCDIVKAGIKAKFLPRLGLPFLRTKKGKSGSLDFVYLDRDLRITRGNRGGLFVHARPEVAMELSKA